jgi:hypothetical protein
MRNRLKHLEMRLRARTPKFLKTTYRLARSFEKVDAPREINPALLKDCRVCSSRHELVSLLPAHARVAELGTFRGDFARVIVTQAQPAELHLVDIDYTPFKPDQLNGPEVHKHIGLTTDVLGKFADDFFDWIYVDGDHSYAGCLADAQAAAGKVRAGGYLVFNDFAHIDPYMGRYGVQRAVTDFANENSWTFAFFAFEPHGLYDVALQKPVKP